MIAARPQLLAARIACKQIIDGQERRVLDMVESFPAGSEISGSRQLWVFTRGFCAGYSEEVIEFRSKRAAMEQFISDERCRCGRFHRRPKCKLKPLDGTVPMLVVVKYGEARKS